jgi:hypothetical protein
MMINEHELAATSVASLSISFAVQVPVHHGPSMYEWKKKPCPTIQDKDDASTK